MKIQHGFAILAIVIILCLPSISFADPIAMSPAPFVLTPLFLILEGVLIVLLARRSLLYQIRFIVLWFFVTLVTFLGFMAWARMCGPITLSGSLLSECFIVVVEAGAIYIMLRWSFLARNLEAAPSITRALMYSLAANVLSLVSSYVALLVGAMF